MTDETQTIRGEIGTSGDFAEVDITGDSGADIASAIVLEHHCDSASCDIDRAMDDGYPFWAASLLQGATETPLLDAVIAHYCAAGLDFAAIAERDREQWLASETWTQHAHKCGSCGAVTFGDDYWTPTQCDDCGAELTTDETSAAGYVIVVNLPGYMPEADPIELDVDETGESGAEAEQVLRAIREEVEHIADTCIDFENKRLLDDWDALLREIDDDYERAADFDPRAGFLYRMPDGYVIEATYRS